MINVSLQVTGDSQTDKWTISQSLPRHPSPTGLYIWILEFSTRNLGPILCFSNNPLVNVGATFEYFAYQSDCELVGSISNCSLLMIAATGTGGVGAPCPTYGNTAGPASPDAVMNINRKYLTTNPSTLKTDDH